MRIRRYMTVSFALCGVGLGACDGAREGAALAPDIEPVLASSSAAEAGEGSGAIITRFSTIQFILVFDAERQRLAAHMPSDICGDGAFNVVEFLRVQTPSEIGQIIAKQTANESVAIYQATSLAEAGLASDISFIGFSDLVDVAKFCDFMSGPNLIAEGTVNQVATFSLASFHGSWVGTIQGVDGRDYRLTEVYQLNADISDPNNPDTFTEPVVQVLLRPIE